MSYILFDTNTTKIVRIVRNGYWQDARFATMAAAKAGATRLHNAGKLVTGSYSILEASEFTKIEKTETVINMMSGKPVVQSVNTPNFLDVSSEAYWSM